MAQSKTRLAAEFDQLTDSNFRTGSFFKLAATIVIGSTAGILESHVLSILKLIAKKRRL
jgi:hypothetical protein